jgi:L-lactate dehydrogenase (cytochrome)
MEAASSSQTLFFQLYKHSNDAIAEQRVREVESLGYKAIFLTVDAIVAGNRERDVRHLWESEDEERGSPKYWSDADAAEEQVNQFGTAGALVANDDRDMTWEKVRQLSSYWDGPDSNKTFCERLFHG